MRFAVTSEGSITSAYVLSATSAPPHLVAPSDEPYMAQTSSRWYDVHVGMNLIWVRWNADANRKLFDFSKQDDLGMIQKVLMDDGYCLLEHSTNPNFPLWLDYSKNEVEPPPLP